MLADFLANDINAIAASLAAAVAVAHVVARAIYGTRF